MKINTKLIAVGVMAAFIIYIYYNDTSQNHQTTMFFAMAALAIGFILFRGEEGKKKITMREAIKYADQWIFEQKEAGIMGTGTIQRMTQCCLYREKGEPVSYWIGYEKTSESKHKFVVVVDVLNGDVMRFKELPEWSVEDQKDVELIVLPEAVAGIKLISEFQGKTTQIADGTSTKK